MSRVTAKPQLAYKGRMEKHDDHWWLIWSNKNGCWYRPKSQGYTSDITQAGLFTKEEAASHYNADAPKKYRITEPFPVSAVKRHIDLCERDIQTEFRERMAAISNLRMAMNMLNEDTAL